MVHLVRSAGKRLTDFKYFPHFNSSSNCLDPQFTRATRHSIGAVVKTMIVPDWQIDDDGHKIQNKHLINHAQLLRAIIKLSLMDPY